MDLASTAGGVNFFQITMSKIIAQDLDTHNLQFLLWIHFWYQNWAKIGLKLKIQLKWTIANYIAPKLTEIDRNSQSWAKMELDKTGIKLD